VKQEYGMSFWGDLVAEQRAKNEQLPLPTIPQREHAARDTSIASLVEAAKAAAAKPDPAVGVLSTPKTLTGGRQAMTPGADVSQVSRRPGPAAEPKPDLLDLSPAERGALVALGTRAGKFADTSVARDAHENAALVQAAIKDKTWDITEDRTPRKVSRTDISGFVQGTQ
jgi:hypothetical protein